MIDKLSEIFNVAPTQKIEAEVVEILPSETYKNDFIQTDYEKTRGNLYELLRQGQDAVNHALEIAKVSEHPRAFEVVGGLMKHVADINHQLLDLHTKHAKLESKDTERTPQGVTNVTNNSVFVGSTTELSKMIEQMRKDK
jgi:hypothetical protein